MKSSFQFSMRSALVATLLMAVWCGLLATHGFGLDHLAIRYAVVGVAFHFLAMGLPAAAIGTLLGRADIGVLCGLTNALAMWAANVMAR